MSEEDLNTFPEREKVEDTIMKEYNSLQAEYKLIWTQNPKRLGYLQSLFTKELCQL